MLDSAYQAVFLTLVIALAIAVAGGGIVIVAICALGYPLTRFFQKSIPGT